MKKLFFIAAIAGAALVSCTKNELAPSATEQHEITFAAPVVGVQTKANYSGGIGLNDKNGDREAYPTNETFNVWAVYNTNTITAWGGKEYFSNITAEFDTNAQGWGLTPRYFWPANGMLSFVALSPSIAATESNGVTSPNYTAKNGFYIKSWSQSASEEGIIDLMYSNESRNNARGHYNLETGEENGSTVNDITKEDGNSPYKGVDLTFNHALSYLVFNICTKEDYSESTKFMLTKIELDGIYTTGEFTQNEEDPWIEDTEGTEGKYVAYAGSNEVVFSKTVTKVPETKNKEIILLPQALSEDQQTITVEYSISTDGGKTWIPQTQTANLTNIAVDAWEMGKKYTYTITIGMTEILFDPAVAVWTPATNGGQITL